MQNKNKYKLAILISHPIQYHSPLFKKMNEHSELEVKVFFMNKATGFDKQFGKIVEWDIPLFDGYEYQFLENKLQIYTELKRNRFDGLLIYGWNKFQNWIALFRAYIIKLPVLLFADCPYNQEVFKKGIKQYIKKRLVKIFFKGIKSFLYLGKQAKDFYLNYGIAKDDLFFTPFAVDNDRFRKAYNELKNNRNSLREEHGFLESDIIILFAGKFIYKKRPLHLLSAYKKAKEKYSGKRCIKLLMIGSGELQNEIEEYIKVNKLSGVSLPGFVNQSKLPEYYTIADIFVLPSGLLETWGLVVNEAMNYDLPVIVSDIPGSAYDLVHEGVNGYVFKLGDIEVLSDKILELVRDEDKRKTFGKRSYEIVSEYCYENDIQGLLEALNHLSKRYKK